MAIEAQPIESFINQIFSTSRISKVIAGWRIEPGKLEALMVSYIKEMGIHFVAKHQRETLIDSVIFYLKRSNDIKILVKKAETDENDRRRSRHADV